MAVLIGALGASFVLSKVADVVMDNVISPLVDKIDDATNYVSRNNPVVIYQQWEHNKEKIMSKQRVNKIRSRHIQNMKNKKTKE